MNSDIRQIIATATALEQEAGELRGLLQPQLPRLQARLVLPEPGPMDALMAFINRYIDSVPGTISLVRAVSQQLGFYDYAAPFLQLAEDYFLHPPADLGHGCGYLRLLEQAFLAHRLLEEVNDHHIRHMQRPLLPVDMTEANIIVHHLLGEAQANTLESLVDATASGLLNREYVWDRVPSIPKNFNIPTTVRMINPADDEGAASRNYPDTDRRVNAIRLRLAG